ncbi:MAG TPA: fatty acid desaturase [Kofleriaceae bacterium]|nr:fatty acid desaturase [Kofleriaceae bacterium]
MIAASDLRALRADLTASGVFDHRTAHTWAKLAILLAAVGAALALVALLPWWCAFALVPLAAVPAATAAMIGHEAAHGSFAAGKRHNDIVTHLVFPLFSGLGAEHWKHKHNHLHHGNPNVIGRDPDLNVWPMALSSEEHAASSPLRRWFQRTLQGYLFWPLTLLLAFAMRVESWRHVVSRVRDGRLDRALVLDAACMVAHYTLWLVLPIMWFGALPVLLVYAGLWGTSGLLLALVFAPAHMGLPVRGGEQRGGWRHQLETTRNLDMPRWLSWFFVGLDFQVEHHLFPRIPHQNLEKASRTVAPWCARVGAPYQRIDYASSIRQVTRHVRRSWQTAPEFVVPPSKLETLTLGSRVFYPGHGVVSVVGREERAFGGDVQVFYVLALLSDRAATVMLPIDKLGQAGIRPLVSATKARALMRAVAEAPELADIKSDPASRKHRASGYSEALRSGSADRYTQTVRELLARFRAGKLSPSDHQTLNQALSMFVGEVSAALDRGLDDVRAELRASGDLPTAGWW